MKASASLPKSVYTKAALRSAALAMSGRGRFSLSSSGSRWIVETEGDDARRARAALGDFLNEALSVSLRRTQMRRSRPLIAAVASRLFYADARPNASPRKDLEPLGLRQDREQEAARLVARARTLR